MEIIFDPSFNITELKNEPGWFDYFSLLITVLSIVGAYLTARYFYKKERQHSESEKNAIENAEIDLFDNNISDLKYHLDQQINAIDEYIEKKDFSLSFSTNLM